MSMAYTIKRYVGFVSLVVFLLILSTEARAEIYGFAPLSNNSGVSGDVATQLYVEVTDNEGSSVPLPPAPGEDPVEHYQALFTFYNDGPIASSITDVYFEDGTLLEIAQIIDGGGVSFSDPADPSNLTEHNNAYPPFVATAGFTADSDPAVQPNGVNPGESLGILFTLKYGETFADVLDAIDVGLDPYDPLNYDGESWLKPHIRIGIRVQGIGSSGESDSFIMTPEPGSLLLGSIGIGMVIARFRKRKTLKES